MIKTGKGFEMKLSDETLEALARVIVIKLSKRDYYSRDLTQTEMLNKLMEFFLDIKEGGHLDVPSEGSYTRKILKEHNGTDFIKKAIEKVLSPTLKYDSVMGGPAYGASNEVEFARVLAPELDRDGYKLVALSKTVLNSHVIGIHYRILDENEFAETPATEENKQVQDIITKAKERFAREDYEGAISSSFNLAETVIKKLLDELNIDYNKNAQFIDIYPKLSKGLNLNPTEENIEGRLEDILKGLKCQVKGLYHLANKASDRHTPEHTPKRQDAKLAMNAAFTLCEYLSDTHKSRQAQ